MWPRGMSVLLLIAAFFLVLHAAFAHHSSSLFDKDKQVTVKGIVREYRFRNPHVSVHFEVKDESGNISEWICESGPPQRLYKAGWNVTTLKPGDEITVTGNPLKSNPKVLSIIRLVGGNIPELTTGAE